MKTNTNTGHVAATRNARRERERKRDRIQTEIKSYPISATQRMSFSYFLLRLKAITAANSRPRHCDFATGPGFEVRILEFRHF